jgi:hypothetical protein
MAHAHVTAPTQLCRCERNPLRGLERWQEPGDAEQVFLERVQIALAELFKAVALEALLSPELSSIRAAAPVTDERGAGLGV